MNKITIKNNTIENYIPIEITKPQIGFIVKEESQQFGSKTYNATATANVNTDTADTYGDLINHQASGATFPINAANSATDYIGAINHNVPHILNPLFTDFKLYNLVTNSFSTLAGASFDSLSEDLFPVTDTEAKVATMFNGLQLVRIPIDRLNDTLNDIKNYGKYYVKIAPKYIDTTITAVTLRKHEAWANVDASDSEGRRQLIRTDNSSFIGTPWGFENPAYKYQVGRLLGSVVEVWDSSLTTKKQTKIINENAISLDSNAGVASFGLSPDNVGYDSPNEAAGVGDILRIYPRETYFNPVYVEIEYQNPDEDITAAIQYIKNDAVRDMTGETIEIYDSAGVTTESDGSLSGTVVAIYQISKENGKEIRRSIKL